MYQEVLNHRSVLVNAIIKASEKIRLYNDLSSNILNYIFIEGSKFAKLYPLRKNHRHLHNVPGRPVISNCGFYTENIFLFLEHHFQPHAQKVKLVLRTLIVL